MRLPSGVTDQYIYFVAVDATDLKTRETGLATWTVYRSRNGGAAAAMTTPTINETDATNMPGVYELLLDEDTTIDAGDDEQEMVFHITHAGMAPVTRTITIFRPKITAGETVTVSSGAVSNVTLVDTTTTNTDMRGTDSAATPAQVATEIADALATDTYAEPGQGTPAATTTLAAKINYLYKNWRNRKTQTSTTWSLYNDDEITVDQKATVADDTTTGSKAEIATGP